MSTVTQHGYMVIADISGYTSFIAKTELEHSHEILSELLEVLVEKFKPLMTLSKLEGDAVFAYVAQEKIARGETLLEFMEDMYVAFRDRQVSMKRATTCTCQACQSIPSLDLKFIAHHGDYIIQHIGDIRELVGSDVNLIHRLTKNHVTEETGWRAYMMFTAHCLEHMRLDLNDAHTQVEEYEHLGPVKTYTLDLHKHYQEFCNARRILIDEKDADAIFRVDLQAPAYVIWEWIHEPARRNLWGGPVHWYAGDRPLGRAGKGASNHCAHGKTVNTEVTLDWRPFEYSTSESFENGKRIFSETFRLEPLPDGGTRLHDVMKMYLPLPRPLRRIIVPLVMRIAFKYDQLLQKLAQLVEEDHSKSLSIR